MATGGAGMSSEQLAEVLRTAKDGMREEISALKRELSQDREAADERLLKKMKLEKAPTFRKKTHEKQFQFNKELACKMDAASAALKEASPALEKAKTLLDEGLKLVCERQKLIRMADRSEHGWATVEEYLEDELAENSDDEKRMQKAEFRAGRKLKAAAAKTARKKSGVVQKRPVQASGAMGRFASQSGSPAAHYALSGTVPVVTPHVAGYKWPAPVGAASTAGAPLPRALLAVWESWTFQKVLPPIARYANRWEVTLM